MEKTKWTLKLYPKGCLEESKDFISFFLERAEDCKGPKNYNIHYNLSFLLTDGSSIESKTILKKSFTKGEIWGYSKLVKVDEVLKIRRKNYLPGNVLTAQCRMWSNIQENTGYGHCFAWTRIAVERRSFLWNIKQFSSFQESVCEITSVSADQSMITLKFFPSSGQNSETFIRVEVRAYDEMLKISTFRLYLLDISGNKTQCLNDEITFGADIKTALFTLTFSKEELMKNKNRYIPNDILQLYCECDIATGTMFEEREDICFGYPPSIKEGNLSNDTLESKKVFSDPTRILIKNLESSYEENLLCDTKLKTKTGSFPAHKNILSARSPVFKAMFTNDMREKNSECVDIEDFDNDTVQRLLLYIYTATLQDLRWDSACNLYASADKYEILSLKSECSSFLKDNLSRDNCCNLLILADKHQDHDLKSVVQDYILNHDVFQANEWKHFMETNLQLAADLMYLKCKK
ncbi:TD and POZ domain-containing protein 3 [Trichonephila clavipes]|nr:TD and POZ domain-containing protein 3 [Trichonephila clavipes]